MRDIAIVGHGQSLIDKDLGGYIDSHEDVLRFAKDPDDAIAVMCREDFGERCDILCFTESGRKRLHLDRRSEKAEHWVYDKRTGPDLEWLQEYQMNRRPDRAGHFSRGTAAVIMACQKGYDEISLFGFDNILHGNNEHYLSCFRDMPLTSKYHDYAMEARIIDAVCLKEEVTLECFPETL